MADSPKSAWLCSCSTSVSICNELWLLARPFTDTPRANGRCRTALISYRERKRKNALLHPAQPDENGDGNIRVTVPQKHLTVTNRQGRVLAAEQAAQAHERFQHDRRHGTHRMLPPLHQLSSLSTISRASPSALESGAAFPPLQTCEAKREERILGKKNSTLHKGSNSLSQQGGSPQLPGGPMPFPFPADSRLASVNLRTVTCNMNTGSGLGLVGLASPSSRSVRWIRQQKFVTSLPENSIIIMLFNSQPPYMKVTWRLSFFNRCCPALPSPVSNGLTGASRKGLGAWRPDELI